MNRKEEIGIMAVGHVNFHHILLAELVMMEHIHSAHLDLIVIQESKEKKVMLENDIPSFPIKNYRENIIPIISVKESVVEKIVFPKKKFKTYSYKNISTFPKIKTSEDFLCWKIQKISPFYKGLFLF